jgi:DNA polymerase III subunit delta'
MSTDAIDPRETPLHPRFAEAIVGHVKVQHQFATSLGNARPHHAWLLSGKQGIGKATLAYRLAKHLLSHRTSQHTQTIDQKTETLIHARSHPDLFVLQRQMGEGKAARLKMEISVDSARQLGEFFAQTAAMSQWRAAIIDTIDDLNQESANALLKLVEEPPPNSVLFLICNQPGRVLRTIKSRCLHVAMQGLSQDELQDVFAQQRFADLEGDLPLAMAHANGSAGRALALLTSDAAKAMQVLERNGLTSPEARHAVTAAFVARNPSVEDFELFVELLLAWTARHARENATRHQSASLAEAHALVQNLAAKTLGLNLDRKTAVLESLVTIDRALKAA